MKKEQNKKGITRKEARKKVMNAKRNQGEKKPPKKYHAKKEPPSYPVYCCSVAVLSHPNHFGWFIFCDSFFPFDWFLLTASLWHGSFSVWLLFI